MTSARSLLAHLMDELNSEAPATAEVQAERERIANIIKSYTVIPGHDNVEAPVITLEGIANGLMGSVLSHMDEDAVRHGHKIFDRLSAVANRSNTEVRVVLFVLALFIKAASVYDDAKRASKAEKSKMH